MKNFCPLILGLCLCVPFAGGSLSAQTESAPATPNSASSKLSPAPSLQFNYLLRLRNDNANNTQDFSNTADDQRIQLRFTQHAAFSFKSAPVEITAGLDNDFYKRIALDPSQQAAYRFNADEIFFEALSVKLKQLKVPGLSLSAGRQEFTRGEGFMLIEGTNGDGSRSTYFNAAILAYQRGRVTYELAGILNPRQERFLPVIHNQNRLVNDRDEQGLVAYYTNRQNKQRDIDAYFIHKKELNDYRAATEYQYQPNRSVETLGARWSQRLPARLEITSEFAGQWGRQHPNAVSGAPAKDVRAWGGYAYAQKSFDRPWKPYVKAGFVLLSGNDPNNANTAGGFELVFGRREKWSTMYGNAQKFELGSGYWSNNRMVHAEVGMNPLKPLALRATLYSEYAFHPFGKMPAMFSTGTHRGENLQLSAIYTVNPSWNYRLVYERFAPGDYYTGHNAGYLFRFQLIYQINKRLFGPVAKKSQ